MSKRYHQLQKRCKDLNLSPCRGKGITADVLERMIAEAEGRINVETSPNLELSPKRSPSPRRELSPKRSPSPKRETSPKSSPSPSPRRSEKSSAEEFRKLYPYLYGRLPKMQMKGEWENITQELNELEKDPAYKAFQIVSSDDIYPQNPSLIKESAPRILKYPTISKFLPYLLSHDGFNGIMVATGNINRLKDPIYPSIISYLQTEEDAQALYERYPNLVRLFPRAVEDAIRQGDLSTILWLIEQLKNEKQENRLDFAAKPDPHYLDLAIREKQPEILKILLRAITPDQRTLSLALKEGEAEMAEIIRQHPQFIEEKVEEPKKNPFEEIMELLMPHLDKKQLPLVRKELEKAIDSPHKEILYAILNGDAESFDRIPSPETLYLEFPHLVQALQRVAPPQPYRNFLRTIVKSNFMNRRSHLNKGVISLLRNKEDAASISGYMPHTSFVITSASLTKAIRQRNLGESVWTLFQDTMSGYSIRVNISHLLEAIEAEDPMIVKALLADSRIDPSANNNEAVYQAAKLPDPSILRLLLIDSRVNPAVDDNEPLIKAAELGNIETLRILLNDPRTDPSDRDNEAIKMAMTLGEEEVARLLLRDSRVREKLSQEEIDEWERSLGLFGP